MAFPGQSGRGFGKAGQGMVFLMVIVMSKKDKVPVSVRAIVQRVNRKLKGQILKGARGGRVECEIGKYYVIDVNENIITRKNVDLDSFCREVGVIEEWERIE